MLMCWHLCKRDIRTIDAHSFWYNLPCLSNINRIIHTIKTAEIGRSSQTDHNQSCDFILSKLHINALDGLLLP